MKGRYLIPLAFLGAVFRAGTASGSAQRGVLDFSKLDIAGLEARRAQETYKQMDGVWHSSRATKFGDGMVVPGQVCVRFRPGLSPTEGLAALKQTTVPRIAEFSMSERPVIGTYWVLDFPKELDVMEVMERLKGTGLIAFAYPSTLAQCSLTPNDPSFGSQWHLDSTDVSQAWDMTTGSSNILIGVIDTGVQLTHGDLYWNYDYANDWDYAANPDDGEPEPYGDGLGREHGTAVAGIIAAMSNNSRGVAGVAGGNWATSTAGATVTMMKIRTHSTRR